MRVFFLFIFHHIMSSSEATIRESFLDFIWPTILEENICEIENENVQEFFKPQVKFDNLWAHTLLAGKCFGEYDKSLELPTAHDVHDVNTEENLSACDEFEQLPYRTPVPAIMPLDQQLAVIERDIETRRKLANDFANRTFPWYIQRRPQEYNFQISENMKLLFQNPFELEILQNIQKHNCNLMLIDLPQDAGLKELERWMKFSPYVSFVTIIHDTDLYRQVLNFNNAFMTTFLEINPENSWHDELSRSLNAGVEFAIASHVYDNFGKTFIFVFANNRHLCTCDKFKILRKF
ncbi:uncharacterized protein [Musca autumnalis]|uniref:uncharacterized protein n=1 Tax=Musca autumnalis TaxID=221902 RepID=UPI003CE82CC3